MRQSYTTKPQTAENGMQGNMEAKYPTLTGTLLINDAIERSSDTDWHTKSGTINISDYQKLMIKVGPHGAMYNCAEVDVRTLEAWSGQYFSVYGNFSTESQGGFTINRSGSWTCTAKTGIAFDYMVWGFK